MKLQDPRLILLLFLASLALGLSGCHAHPIAPATTLVTSARSLSGLSSAVAQVQSSPLYQQARQDCKLHAYRKAADDLQALPDISPPAILWVNRNHYVALTDLSGRGEQASGSVWDPNKPSHETLLQEQILQQSAGFLLLVHR